MSRLLPRRPRARRHRSSPCSPTEEELDEPWLVLWSHVEELVVVSRVVTGPDVHLSPQPKGKQPWIPTVAQVRLRPFEFPEKKAPSCRQTLAKGNSLAALPRLHAVNARVRRSRGPIPLERQSSSAGVRPRLCRRTIHRNAATPKLTNNAGIMSNAAAPSPQSIRARNSHPGIRRIALRISDTIATATAAPASTGSEYTVHTSSTTPARNSAMPGQTPNACSAPRQYFHDVLIEFRPDDCGRIKAAALVMLLDLFRARLRAVIEEQAIDQGPLVTLQLVAVHLQTEPHRVLALDLAFQFALCSHAGYKRHYLRTRRYGHPRLRPRLRRDARGCCFQSMHCRCRSCRQVRIVRGNARAPRMQERGVQRPRRLPSPPRQSPSDGWCRWPPATTDPE